MLSSVVSSEEMGHLTLILSCSQGYIFYRMYMRGLRKSSSSRSCEKQPKVAVIRRSYYASYSTFSQWCGSVQKAGHRNYPLYHWTISHLPHASGEVGLHMAWRAFERARRQVPAYSRFLGEQGYVEGR